MLQPRPLARVAATLLLAAPVTVPAELASQAFGSLATRCGTLIDGVSPEPRRGLTVVIQPGRITEMGAAVVPPAGLELIDLAGYTCLPGSSTCIRISPTARVTRRT